MGAYARANGLSIYYEQAGTGPDLVLIAGLGASTHVWYPQLHAHGLSSVFRVTAFDPRGHGLTDKPAGPYSLHAMAEDAAAFLDVAGISRAVVVGSSMSSLIAVELAAMRPDLVEGLILVGGFPGLGPAGKEAFEQRAVLAETQGMGPLADLVPARAFGAHSHATQPGLVGLFRQGILANDPAAYAASCRAIRDADVTPLLASVGCPALILLGEQEQVAPLTAARALKAGIPHAQLRVLANAGHLPFIEQPAAFNAAVQEFVGSL
jgi:pimeloyl-ACP methyl ester carboxylesterase